MSQPDRILIIRPSALGDVCRSVPVLASLARACPNAKIDWLVRDAYADAVAHHPALARVIEFPRSQLGRELRRGRPGNTLAWLRQLRDARYDWVFDFQGLARSGLFAWATRATRRVGFADAREFGWLGVNERHQLAPNLHAVDRMLGLVKAAGIDPIGDMRLHAPTPDAHLASILRSLGEEFVVVAPTSAWEGKRWPADRFANLIRTIRTSADVSVVLVGAPNERQQCGPLLGLAADTPGVHDLIGRTNVGQLMAIIERARLVVANDSAAVHMAVGFDRPLVALYGPTRIDLVGPYAREADVIQASPPTGAQGTAMHKDTRAGLAMMEQISEQRVIEAVMQRLRSPAPTNINRGSPQTHA